MKPQNELSKNGEELKEDSTPLNSIIEIVKPWLDGSPHLDLNGDIRISLRKEIPKSQLEALKTGLFLSYGKSVHHSPGSLQFTFSFDNVETESQTDFNERLANSLDGNNQIVPVYKAADGETLDGAHKLQILRDKAKVVVLEDVKTEADKLLFKIRIHCRRSLKTKEEREARKKQVLRLFELGYSHTDIIRAGAEKNFVYSLTPAWMKNQKFSELGKRSAEARKAESQPNTLEKDSPELLEKVPVSKPIPDVKAPTKKEAPEPVPDPDLEKIAEQKAQDKIANAAKAENKDLKAIERIVEALKSVCPEELINQIHGSFVMEEDKVTLELVQKKILTLMTLWYDRAVLDGTFDNDLNGSTP